MGFMMNLESLELCITVRELSFFHVYQINLYQKRPNCFSDLKL